MITKLTQKANPLTKRPKKPSLTSASIIERCSFPSFLVGVFIIISRSENSIWEKGRWGGTKGEFPPLTLRRRRRRRSKSNFQSTPWSIVNEWERERGGFFGFFYKKVDLFCIPALRRLEIRAKKVSLNQMIMCAKILGNCLSFQPVFLALSN